MDDIILSTTLHEINIKNVYPDIPLTPEFKKQLKKNKDSVMHKEMKANLVSFINRLPSNFDKDGKEIIKCKISSFMIPVKPKSMQGEKKKIYRKYLEDFFKTKSKSLERFKELGIFVYICVFLSKKRYSTNVDNIAKPIIDAMKPYFEGDRKITVLIVEKKMLDEKYPEDDLDYLQNSMIIVVDANYRDVFLKI